MLRKKAEEEDSDLNQGHFIRGGQHSIRELQWGLNYIKYLAYTQGGGKVGLLFRVHETEFPFLKKDFIYL